MKSGFKRFAFFLIVFVFLPGVANSQISKRKLRSDFALEKNREKYIISLNKKIEKEFGKTPLEVHEKQWRKLFYELSVDLYGKPEVKKALEFVFAKTDTLGENLTIDALLAARALYPKEFEKEIKTLFIKTKRLQTAVYSFHYLYMLNKTKYARLFSALENKFGNKNLLIKLTEKFVKGKKIYPDENQLEKIFSKDFLKDELVIFTILRSDRKIPGITIIRKPDGEFLRYKNSLFAIRQLGYSVNDFPYYLKNGNTPQGLYRFKNFYQSKKKSIGPTPIPIIRLPFETSAKKFGVKSNKNVWTKEAYRNLLPEILRKNESFYETYYAGKLGRKLLVLHGSTDNPQLYKNEPYFPLTPSTGCLTSYEKWDKQNGKLIESDQLKLVNAILSTGRKNGYLFVFELDDGKTPVELNEIKKFLTK